MPQRRRYRRLVIIPAILGLAGAAMLITETLTNETQGPADLARWGMLAMLAAIGLTNLIVVWSTREPADAMWRDGYDLGYQRGLEAGTEQVRPTVVPIRRRDAAG